MTKIKVKSAPVFVPFHSKTDDGDWFCSGCGKMADECDGSCEGNNTTAYQVDIFFGSRDSYEWDSYLLRYETGF